ncbi:MAG: protein translocase subunit SecF [Xanthomonadales bacterium]|mgnify:CR=1 FL=1|nr:protein translocase subunit SecF [Xanthomonadales bacterium]ODU93900.1 MAG: protein-export membrane protein SecF [Rhodanobacter sp. SCN 66-43]OJY82607.1 MAG: protein-export membrane protein SecF [Xanthomonadales bacterium 66-474]
MEIFHHDLNIDFLGMRKVSIVISAILLIVSVWAITVKGLNYGLDFTGGILIEVNYEQPVDVGDVRGALEKAGFEHAVVQSMGGTRDISIRLQPPKATDNKESPDQVAGEVSKRVLAALQAGNPGVKLAQPPDFVGPEVGQELKTSGIYAAIVVIIGIMFYLWMRFEKRFAFAAVVSEIHDTVITVGIIALVQREFDMTVLASVLAVIGYSINDKVVVFDRVRELFRLTRKAETPQILNRAINNTLSRTIITSVFTAITMASLWLFGGTAVHGFAITMLIGILVGTLSSIFFASPLLLWFGVSKTDLMPVTKENPELARRP